MSVALRRLAAPLFVVFSGSGFVGARLGLPHAEPFAFLALRFALAAAVLAGLAGAFSAPWPRRPQEWLDVAGAGLLGVGMFSAGVFYSIAGGLPPAASALIIALQPILIAIAAPALLGERVTAGRWGGLLLGLGGVVLVLRQGFDGQSVAAGPVACSAIGLAGMAAGQLYQKARCAAIHLLSCCAVQCGVSAIACLAGAAWFEDGRIAWTGEFVAALLWMAVVVSVGAVSLLIVLIRDGEVSRVAGLFYLIPVSAAFAAWLLFGQGIAPLQWLGIAVAGSGVWLAARR